MSYEDKLIDWSKVEAPDATGSYSAAEDDKDKADSALLSMVPPKDYETWKNIGISYKAAGGDLDTFLHWSASDPSNYDEKTARRLFENVAENGKITAGTLYWHAAQNGWRYERDMTATAAQPRKSKQAIPQDKPLDLAPVEQTIAMLTALFEPGEQVNIQVRARWKEGAEEGSGKWEPADGGTCYERDELVRMLREGEIQQLLKGYTKDAGVWVCQNPTNGEGRGKERTVKWRHALIESDELPVEEQIRIMRELDLPITTMTASGGKSVHALVRVDADGANHYDERVLMLHEICNQAGLKVDPNNKDSSRLTRLAGIKRGDARQTLLYTGIGAKNFGSWLMAHRTKPTTPENPTNEVDILAQAQAEPVRTFAEIAPRVNRDRPELIEGVLFEGGEMIISAPAKGGKSTCMIGAMVEASSGGEWLCHKVEKCPTLLINTENDVDDFGNTILDYVEHTGHGDMRNMYVLDLAGKTVPLSMIASDIIAKAKTIEGLRLIIIDPIYPLLGDLDETSNKDMSNFMNLFMQIRKETSAAIIFVHHDSKGAMQYAKAIYRASGAGVFSRHPTTIVNLTQLDVKPEVYKQRLNDEQVRCMDSYLHAHGYEPWLGDQEARIADDYRRECVRTLEPEEMNKLIELLDSGKKVAVDGVKRDSVKTRVYSSTGLKLEITRRGARNPYPSFWWFEYPVFSPDHDGLLGSARDDTGLTKATRREKAAERHEVINALIQAAVEQCHDDGVPPTRRNVWKRMDTLDGEEISLDRLTQWTYPSKNPWCPWGIGEDNVLCLPDT